MKAVRLKICQTSANYRREETIDNKMTYPLPPFSTCIGAIHKACGYQEYHPMELSIQGTYGALKREVYQEHCFLNSLQNDRGTLVKMKNPDLLSKAFVKVASAKKNQGNDFRKGITIQVYDEELLEEYRQLKDKKDEIDSFKKQRINPVSARIKDYKKVLSERKKRFSGDKERLCRIKQRENEIKKIEKLIKERMKEYEEINYDTPYSKFRTLTCGPKYYEVLSDIELVIHIRSDEKVLEDIIKNQYRFSSLGRSEDFVQVKEAEMVELEDLDEDIDDTLPMYIPVELVNSGAIKIATKGETEETGGGTRYYLPKNYILENEIRKFERKSVFYASNYAIEDIEAVKGKIYLDRGKKDYIVCFV